MTDNWDDEEGYIVEGVVIGFCYVGAGVTEARGVAFGTSTANRVTVTAPSGIGDSFGVALKTVSTAGLYVPVAVGGVMKMVCTASLNTYAAGDFVCGGAAGRATLCDHTTNTSNLAVMGGDSHVLGLALQTAAAEGDETLILLGPTC